MISTGELKKGATIEIDGTLYQILEYSHIKMGRGSAQVRMKLKDVRAGHTIEKTVQAGEKFKTARVERHPVQYLYEQDGLHYFMNTETFDQLALSEDQVGEARQYLRENDTCDVLLYENQPIGLELPISVVMEVVETEPGFKGDTQSGGTKPARTDTGLVVNVPLFVNSGDRIKVDTRTGQYQERVS
ncbi:MAG TPA: elongation factor P [Dehalococcoidia bacterium]|nr:elongation factor P [Dehalococcoidia bacterium]